MLDRVKKILGLTSRKTGNKLVVSVEKLERRVALLENNRLEEYSVERSDSRKIEDPKERNRLRKILRELDIPEGIGVIIRTVGEGQRARYFVRDLRFLLDQWSQVEQLIRDKPAPCRVFEEPDLVERTVRDFLTEEIDEVLCDDREAVERMNQLVEKISRRARNRFKFYEGATPIFEALGIQKQIDDAFHRQVWLRCGGYIGIDETEALVAVDVNTGRNKGGRDVEKTILQTNLEAADEIARQLRLRNIGGLIIADFIDMKGRKDQQAVFNLMKERLRRDKAKTHILPISQLGLMEMTRQRAQESLSDTIYENCPYCGGRGVVKTSMTTSVELHRTLNTVMRKYQDSIHEIGRAHV